MAKSDEEILVHYLFVKEDCLTNLGVLWIGVREDRATLGTRPRFSSLRTTRPSGK
jgi:ATP-dependent DNA helicase RecG